MHLLIRVNDISNNNNNNNFRIREGNPREEVDFKNLKTLKTRSKVNSRVNASKELNASNPATLATDDGTVAMPIQLRRGKQVVANSKDPRTPPGGKKRFIGGLKLFLKVLERHLRREYSDQKVYSPMEVTGNYIA